MRSIIDLARLAIRDLVPYSSARLENSSTGIQMDANENPFRQEHGFNRYPDPQASNLKHCLAKLYGVNESQLLICRGSDEGIDLLVRVFCEANQDAILITPPTYGMYEVAARIQGVCVQNVPLDSENGFALNAKGILDLWQPGLKLIFLCSPNNPTGDLFDQSELLNLCNALDNKALVIVDEAYIEFSSRKSLAAFIDQYPNLVILRTLSKAFGLAGIRLGSVIAQEELIALIRKALAPYPIPMPVERAASQALSAENQTLVRSQIASICSQRDQLKTFLEGLRSVECVYPSEANFLLVRVKDASKWMSHCKSHQIILRSREKLPNLKNCLRISIGTPQENMRLKEILSYV